MPFAYDAFVSYTTRSDYDNARRVETFLEGFRARWRLPPERVRQLEICRDGSDFRLPPHRDETLTDPILRIIEPELRKSRYLLVLCSPAATESAWVAKEIAAFLAERQRGEVLLAVTAGNDPSRTPEECFPAIVREREIHTQRIWYDLRSLGRPVEGARNAEDELVRLAGDLLDWDAEQDGPLAAVWSREQLRQRRRTTTWIVAAALLLCVAAVFAIVQAMRSSAASRRARANAIILAADASDPLTGTLLLGELAEEGDPGDGMRVARKLAGERIPLAVMRGHTDRITGLAPLPDGRRFVTASADGTLRVWPLDGRGDAVVLQKGPPIEALAVDRRGTFVATGDGEGNLRVLFLDGRPPLQRNVGDGIETLFLAGDGSALAAVTTHSRAFHLHLGSGAVTPLAIEPLRPTAVYLDGGNEGFVAMEDGTVHRFNATLRILSRILGPEETGKDAVIGPFSGESTFSGDGLWVATRLTNELVLRSTGGTANRRLLHDDAINSVVFTRDSQALVTAASDGKARVWSVAGGDPEVFDPAIRYLSPNLEADLPPDLENAKMALAVFAPDGTHVATSTEDGVVRIWRRGSNEPPIELRRQHGRLAFANDGQRLLVEDNAGAAYVWPLAAPDEPRALQRIDTIYRGAMNEEGTLIAAAGKDDAVASVWHPAKTPDIVHALGADVRSCAISGDRIAAAHDGGLVTLHDAGGRKLRELTGATGPLQDVLFTRDGKYVFARNEREVFRWSAGGGPPVIFRGPPAKIFAFALSADGRRLLTCLDNRLAIVWDTFDASKRVILGGARAHEDAVYDGVLNRDGSRAWTVSKDGTARLWCIGDDGTFDATVIPFGPARELQTVTLSPDEKQLVITDFAGRAVLFDAGGKRQGALTAIRELAHVGPIMQAVYSGDGKRLLTCSGADGTARIWDLSGRTRAQLLDGQGGVVTVCGFTSDGTRVFTATEQGFIRLWTVSWRELIARSGARTSATLLPDQRMSLLGETPDEARRNYEQAESRQRRTPLPKEWAFGYPEW